LRSVRRKNEEEIHALRQENKDMRRKLYGERSTPSTQGTKCTKAMTHSNRSRIHRDQSVDEEESPLENSGYVTPDLEQRHPFTDDILGTELPAK